MLQIMVSLKEGQTIFRDLVDLNFPVLSTRILVLTAQHGNAQETFLSQELQVDLKLPKAKIAPVH